MQLRNDVRIILALTWAVKLSAGGDLWGATAGNDNFADRITISGTNTTVTGSNTNATKEVGEPNHARNAGGQSVWWTWTAPH